MNHYAHQLFGKISVVQPVFGAPERTPRGLVILNLNSKLQQNNELSSAAREVEGLIPRLLQSALAVILG